MAGESTGTPAPAGDAGGTAAPAGDLAAQLAALKAENATMAKALGERNAENKTAREAAEKVAAEKVAVEKAAAEKNGEWAKVLEIERAERAKAASDLAAASPKVALADKYEALFAEEANALAAKIGDEAKQFDGLATVDRVRVLRALSARAAGPGAAAAPKVGNPAAPSAPIDFSKLSSDERKAFLAGKTTEQIREIAGFQKPRGLFGS